MGYAGIRDTHFDVIPASEQEPAKVRLAICLDRPDPIFPERNYWMFMREMAVLSPPNPVIVAGALRSLAAELDALIDQHAYMDADPSARAFLRGKSD